MEIKKIDRDNRERINDFIIRQWFSLQMNIFFDKFLCLGITVGKEYRNIILENG